MCKLIAQGKAVVHDIRQLEYELLKSYSGTFSSVDTLGTTTFVLISEASLFQQDNNMNFFLMLNKEL